MCSISCMCYLGCIWCEIWICSADIDNILLSASPSQETVHPDKAAALLSIVPSSILVFNVSTINQIDCRLLRIYRLVAYSFNRLYDNVTHTQ